MHRRQLPPPRPPAMAPNLGEYPALVAMLGIFVSRGDPQHADAARRQEWRLPHLRTALDADAPDWDAIQDRVEASNLQPLLQAIRHHDRHGGLHHIWLISTADVVADDGRVLQAGSCHLAPCVERIVRQGLHHDLAVHHTDPMLLVLPDDIGSSYRAVNGIYTVAAPRLGLYPYQVIADITGGRATMTAGMILACAPRGYPLQYSVFECVVDARGYAQMQASVRKIIKPRLDHVRYYVLCAACRARIETTRGEIETSGAGEALIV
jgi:CRISPR-associated endonuclease Cas2